MTHISRDLVSFSESVASKDTFITQTVMVEVDLLSSLTVRSMHTVRYHKVV